MDLGVYGEAVFADTRKRERFEGLIEDFVQRTQGTMPYGIQNYAAGFERVTQFHLDESSGPGLRWSFRIPAEMSDQFAAEVLAHADEHCLTWGGGSMQITT